MNDEAYISKYILTISSYKGISFAMMTCPYMFVSFVDRWMDNWTDKYTNRCNDLYNEKNCMKGADIVLKGYDKIYIKNCLGYIMLLLLEY